MVIFLRADNFLPLSRYLGDWGRAIRDRVDLIAYEDRPDPAGLPDGAFVFADVDRLTGEAAAAAGALYDALAARGGAARLLNRPGRSLSRFALLRTLHERGWNRFNAYRLDESRDALRFPVFVRHAREHEGAYTPLLPDAAALERALHGLEAAGYEGDDLLIVEFIETGAPRAS